MCYTCARQKRQNVGRQSGIKPGCAGPLPACVRPPARGGPDSNFGVAPVQVRLGRAQTAPGTALKSRAVDDAVSLVFCTDHRPTHSPPSFLVAFPSSIIDHFEETVLLNCVGEDFFSLSLSQDTYLLSIDPTFSPPPATSTAAAVTIAGCNSSSRYRSPVTRPQRGNSTPYSNKSTLTPFAAAHGLFGTLNWSGRFHSRQHQLDLIGSDLIWPRRNQLSQQDTPRLLLRFASVSTAAFGIASATSPRAATAYITLPSLSQSQPQTITSTSPRLALAASPWDPSFPLNRCDAPRVITHTPNQRPTFTIRRKSSSDFHHPAHHSHDSRIFPTTAARRPFRRQDGSRP